MKESERTKKDKNPPNTLKNICVNKCMHTGGHIHVYVYVHTHTHTHTQTHRIYTYTQKSKRNIYIDEGSSQTTNSKVTKLDTKQNKWNKIKTTSKNNQYFEINSWNLPIKSPEEDLKVWMTCSTQVNEIIIIKKC